MMVIIVLIAPLPFVGGLPEWLRWPPVLTVVLAFGLLALGFALERLVVGHAIRAQVTTIHRRACNQGRAWTAVRPA